ncbi:hypothetical protein AB0L22_09185 [Micromonospora haikouensis]
MTNRTPRRRNRRRPSRHTWTLWLLAALPLGTEMVKFAGELIRLTA